MCVGVHVCGGVCVWGGCICVCICWKLVDFLYIYIYIYIGNQLIFILKSANFCAKKMARKAEIFFPYFCLYVPTCKIFDIPRTLYIYIYIYIYEIS